MNQVKKTTTKKLNRSQVLVSDRTLELDKLPSSELSLEMNDARALREFSSDDRPPGTPAATGPTAEKGASGLMPRALGPDRLWFLLPFSSGC